jgi:hypothetical protein
MGNLNKIGTCFRPVFLRAYHGIPQRLYSKEGEIFLLWLFEGKQALNCE